MLRQRLPPHGTSECPNTDGDVDHLPISQQGSSLSQLSVPPASLVISEFHFHTTVSTQASDSVTWIRRHCKNLLTGFPSNQPAFLHTPKIVVKMFLLNSRSCVSYLKSRRGSPQPSESSSHASHQTHPVSSSFWSPTSCSACSFVCVLGDCWPGSKAVAPKPGLSAGCGPSSAFTRPFIPPFKTQRKGHTCEELFLGPDSRFSDTHVLLCGNTFHMIHFHQLLNSVSRSIP